MNDIVADTEVKDGIGTSLDSSSLSLSTSLNLIDDILGEPSDKSNVVMEETEKHADGNNSGKKQGSLLISLEGSDGQQRCFEYQSQDVYSNPQRLTSSPIKQTNIKGTSLKDCLEQMLHRVGTEDDADMSDDEYNSLLSSLEIEEHPEKSNKSKETIDPRSMNKRPNNTDVSLWEFLVSMIKDIWNHTPTVARLSMISLFMLLVFLEILYNETDDEFERRPISPNKMLTSVMHTREMNHTVEVPTHTETDSGFGQHHHSKINDEKEMAKGVSYLTNVVYKNLANVTITDRDGTKLPVWFDNHNEIPVFFHVPKSGGTTLEHVLGQCIGLVQASQFGAQLGVGLDLEVLPAEGSLFNYLYVNVDTFSNEGIHKAKQMELIPSGYADVLHTSRLYDVMHELFPTNPDDELSLHHGVQMGRMFVLMRHPVDRAVSMYYHLRNAEYESTFDHTLKTYTLEQYAQRAQTENNWMTRTLCNVPLSEQLYPHHLAQAKYLLQQKALIGILDRLEESIERFEKYFGWNQDPAKDEKQSHMTCQTHLLLEQQTKKPLYPTLGRDTETWQQLYRRNWFDIELYTFATELFRNQTSWFI